MTTYKALDHYDALKAGHTYERVRSYSKRLVRLEDIVSHDYLSLYQWQVEDAMLRNKLVVVPDVQSPEMAGVTLCKHTSSGFGY